MEKLNMHSPDLTAANIGKLAALFPNCVTESQDGKGNLSKSIDFDLLRQELSGTVVEGPVERYTLTWPGKREAILAANAPVYKTLRPCEAESVDFENTQNLYIEGDNLEVLKLLQETYLGKVKMIFIDPPYNTGHDFIYDDDFADDVESDLIKSSQKNEAGGRLVPNPDSNGRFHSDWLSMMYSRIKLAKTLLRSDGFIYVTIDDTEVANLRKLMDEVFGADNFVANVIWQKKYTRSNDAKWFSDTHDHVLVYAVEKLTHFLNLLPRSSDQEAAYSNPDNHPKGKWKATPLHAKSGTNTKSYEFSNGISWAPPPGTYRRFNDDTMRRMDEGDEIWFGPDGKAVPSRKSFLCDVKQGVTSVTIWPYDEVGHNHEANNELKEFIGEGIFDNPKPVRLVNRMQHLSTNAASGDIILDFFSGSSTTAHSVMQLNAEDGGNRRFIMVQLPEICDEKSEAFKAGYKNICEIGKERIRRAGRKIKDENSTNAPNQDVGFRVFKVDSSNMKEVYYTPDALEQSKLDLFADAIKEDRTAEDLLFQVFLDCGLDLALPIAKETVDGKTVFFVDRNVLVACFAADISDALIRELAGRKPRKAVFLDRSFAKDSTKLNVTQIFKQLAPGTEVKTI